MIYYEIFYIIILLFVLYYKVSGTNTKLTGFISNKYAMSTSERINSQQRDLQIYGPFYKILFIDSLIPNNYLSEFSSSIYIKLKTRRSDQTLFYYGRPLWGSILAHSNSDTVLEMAKNKLLFNIDWESINSKFLPSLVLLSVRTTLSISYQVKYGSDLISHFLATVFYISDDRTNYAFRYFSEPILAAGKFF